MHLRILAINSWHTTSVMPCAFLSLTLTNPTSKMLPHLFHLSKYFHSFKSSQIPSLWWFFFQWPQASMRSFSGMIYLSYSLSTYFHLETALCLSYMVSLPSGTKTTAPIKQRPYLMACFTGIQPYTVIYAQNCPC